MMKPKREVNKFVVEIETTTTQEGEISYYLIIRDQRNNVKGKSYKTRTGLQKNIGKALNKNGCL